VRLLPSLRTPTSARPDDRHPIARALLGTWPGRAVVVGSGVKLSALLINGVLRSGLPLVDLIGSLGTLTLLLGLAYYTARLVGLARQHLLWRVRRKLILSYIFVGLVPLLLIIIFGLLCGQLLFGSVSQYIITTRLRSAIEQAQFLAKATAIDVGHIGSSEEIGEYLTRKQSTLATRYPMASIAVVPVGRLCPGTPEPSAVANLVRPSHTVPAGPWQHLPPPDRVPDWVPCLGYAGLIAYALPATADPANASGTDAQLAVRAVALPDGPTPRYAVVLDLPVTLQTAERLREDTGIELRAISTSVVRPQVASSTATPLDLASSNTGVTRRFQVPWVVFLDFADWQTGALGRATLSVGMRLREIYDRLSPSRLRENVSFSQTLVAILVVVGVLFLIIQFVAVLMGLALARSITGSVHELFVGTARVQQGDFTHRIEVRARDQLGELATSFNTMMSRLAELLSEMAEKKRLEEELRIARSIQMSLLPQGPAYMPGLQMTAHCSPAREVGGDYYDFLPLSDRRIGILIADVSGKGTSAALYMAELKGLMLSLSEIHQSPRALMIAANRIIAKNLDSRSFITMTYAILDMDRMTMRYARAGHTPLIHLPGHGLARRARILIPDGMVLGLNIDHGERFEAVLEEVELPLEPGDLFVLFTDGITEAMNAAEDLFGEGRLGTLIEDHADLPFDELRERILREVRAFTGEAGPHDDMTLILLKVEDVAAGAVVRPFADVVAT
jgi:sigma-B regulation protein RsbU (phosphoserine phosphatase)